MAYTTESRWFLPIPGHRYCWCVMTWIIVGTPFPKRSNFMRYTSASENSLICIWYIFDVPLWVSDIYRSPESWACLFIGQCGCQVEPSGTSPGHRSIGLFELNKLPERWPSSDKYSLENGDFRKLQEDISCIFVWLCRMSTKSSFLFIQLRVKWLNVVSASQW